MAYQLKTTDEWHIEGNCGYGWEVENVETTRQDAKRSIKEYRDNCNYPVRLTKKRVKILPTIKLELVKHCALWQACDKSGTVWKSSISKQRIIDFINLVQSN